MITPAYSATATERVLPRLALDFTTGVLDPRVTVTRALNTATCVNSAGTVVGVNANLPRFDFDPVTLAPRGLLIEEARTNLFLQSSDTTQSDWTKVLVSVSTTTTSPDGTANAYKVSENSTATDAFYLRQNASSPAGAHTLSFFAKKAERDVIFATLDGASNTKWFDLTNGTTGGSGGGTSRIIAYPNGWYRCEYAFTTSSGTLNNFLFLSNTTAAITHTGSVGSGLFIWGAQLEAGAFATSYIPTTTTSLTRNRDIVTMTGTNFSDWFNGSQGAFIGWFTTFASTGIRYIAAASASGAIANSLLMSVINTETDSYVNSGGVEQARLLTGTIAANVPAKLGLRYANANFAVAANGGGLVTQLSGSLPVGINQLNIGALSNTGFQLNGHMAKFFWYTSLTNAELVAFTK